MASPIFPLESELKLTRADVPGFDLRAGQTPQSPTTSIGQSETPSLSSDGQRRASSASSSRSGSSSRSASFSLPNKPQPVRPGGRSTSPAAEPSGPLPLGLGATHANTAANSGEDVFDDSDEEKDEETKAKEREFRGKRKEHYAKEAAIAMKKARELMEKEEAEGEGSGEGEEQGQGQSGANGGDAGLINGNHKVNGD